MAERPVVGRTRHGELTLDEIASMQPGLGRLMLEVSERFWILYHAAKGENWGLAAYQLRSLRKTLKLGAQTRPGFAADLAEYDRSSLEPLARAVMARRWQAFEDAYGAATAEANRYHDRLGFGYIQWQLPSDPPPHLRLFRNDEVEKRAD